MTPLARFVNSRTFQALPTWAWEFAVAFTWLGCVTGLTTDWTSGRAALAPLVALFAVLGTFGHMTVAARLEEAEARTTAKTVDCHRWLTRYLVAKESLWLLAFVLLHAWTALAGVPLFLLYPAWRRMYRTARAKRTGEMP